MSAGSWVVLGVWLGVLQSLDRSVNMIAIFGFQKQKPLQRNRGGKLLGISDRQKAGAKLLQLWNGGDRGSCPRNLSLVGSNMVLEEGHQATSQDQTPTTTQPGPRSPPEYLDQIHQLEQRHACRTCRRVWHELHPPLEPHRECGPNSRIRRDDVQYGHLHLRPERINSSLRPTAAPFWPEKEKLPAICIETSLFSSRHLGYQAGHEFDTWEGNERGHGSRIKACEQE